MVPPTEGGPARWPASPYTLNRHRQAKYFAAKYCMQLESRYLGNRGRRKAMIPEIPDSWPRPQGDWIRNPSDRQRFYFWRSVIGDSGTARCDRSSEPLSSILSAKGPEMNSGKLTEAMMEAIRQSECFPLATASESGMPNVVPIKFVFIESPDEIWLVDNFFLKSWHNLQENPVAALYVYQPDDGLCFQLKGAVKLRESGEKYARMRALVHQTRPDLPARSLVVMRISAIYQCMPGAGAGERIG